MLNTIGAGTWPTWISAVFTSLAAVTAALTYWRSVNVRREAQARLIYTTVEGYRDFAPGDIFEVLPNGATMGTIAAGAIIDSSSATGAGRLRATEYVLQVEVAVHNRSNELIGPFKIQLVDTGLKRIYETFSLSADAIAPESDMVISFVFSNNHHPGQPGIRATLIFRDASGAWWRRHASELVERVHNDPENTAPTKAERAQHAANAIALGIVPSPEPKVPWRAWLHRRVRVLRGKSPTP